MRLVYQFKVKRSKVRVTRPIHADTSCAIFRMARPTNFKLGVRMEDDDPHQPQALLLFLTLPVTVASAERSF